MKDKVAIVTGAGRGIGRAIAHRFAAEGASVVVAEIDTQKGREVVDVIRAKGGMARLCECDVTREDQVQSMVDVSLAELGRVDILVNNAISSIEVIHNNSWETVEVASKRRVELHSGRIAYDDHTEIGECRQYIVRQCVHGARPGAPLRGC